MDFSGEGVESETLLVLPAKYNSPEQQIEELPPFYGGVLNWALKTKQLNQRFVQLGSTEEQLIPLSIQRLRFTQAVLWGLYKKSRRVNNRETL